MYKYFISFTCIGGTGNVVIEANHKISDFDNIDDMQEWINSAQRWIEDNADVKNVTIVNFKLIN